MLEHMSRMHMGLVNPFSIFLFFFKNLTLHLFARTELNNCSLLTWATEFVCLCVFAMAGNGYWGFDRYIHSDSATAERIHHQMTLFNAVNVANSSLSFRKGEGAETLEYERHSLWRTAHCNYFPGDLSKGFVDNHRGKRSYQLVYNLQKDWRAHRKGTGCRKGLYQDRTLTLFSLERKVVCYLSRLKEVLCTRVAAPGPEFIYYFIISFICVCHL